jgi:TolB protein
MLGDMTRLHLALPLVLVGLAPGLSPQQPAPAPPRLSRPAWSADGRRLVYDMDPTGRPALFSILANGASNRPISTFQAADFGAVWSPDSRRLAFVSDREGGRPRVFLADANGANATRLSTEPGEPSEPAWSPDGRLVA